MRLHGSAIILAKLFVISALSLAAIHAQTCTIETTPIAIRPGPSELIGDLNITCLPALPNDFSILVQLSDVEPIEIVNPTFATANAGALSFPGSTSSSTGVSYSVSFSITGAAGSQLRLSGIRANSAFLTEGSLVNASVTMTSSVFVYTISGSPAIAAHILPQVTIRTSNLPTGSLGKVYVQPLQALGGTLPFSNWIISSGSLPPGLSLNAATGEIAGTPTAGGTYNFGVTVKDNAGVTSLPKDLSLSVSSLPTIPTCFAIGTNLSLNAWGKTEVVGDLILTCSPSVPTTGSIIVELNTMETPPNIVPVFHPELAKISAGVSSNGIRESSNSVRFSFSGASGTTLTASGILIDATPVPPISQVTATVTLLDDDSVVLHRSDPRVIGTTLPFETPTITNPSVLSNGTIGTPYAPLTITISDPTPPMGFWVGSGTLPPGLSLDFSTGEITGVPTTVGEFHFAVRVQNGPPFYGSSPVKIFSLTITSPVAISTSSLPSGLEGSPYDSNLVATDGLAPYSNWTISNGSLPPGMALNAATGRISGIPTLSGTYPFTVTVKDSTDAQSAPAALSITVGSRPAITTSSFPNATVGRPYALTLAASGGSSIYPTWVVSSGNLPPGLTLNLSGMISGTPSAFGSFPFSITVRDGAGVVSLPKSFVLTVAPPPLTITSGSLLNGATRGVDVSYQLTANGGVAPYSWTLASGSIAPGMVLNANGLITGAPSRSGVFTFTIAVRDSRGTTASQAFSMDVAGLRIVTPPVLPTGGLGSNYSLTLTAAGAASSYQWSLASGSLPSGLTLFSNGVISGSPLFSGTATFSARATEVTPNVVGQQRAAEAFSAESAVQTFTLSVPPGISITTTSLRDGTVAAPYSQTLEARGGRSLGWSLVDGTLPGGMSLSSSGEINGTPTTFGTSTFRVRAADNSGVSDTKTFILRTVADYTRAGVLSHIAAGGEWNTAITLVNPSPFPVNVKLNFRGNDGKPLVLAIKDSQQAAIVERTIQPRGSLVLETADMSSAVLTGWADVLSSGEVTGYAVFRQKTQNGSFSEGTVQLDRAPLGSFTLPFDNTQGFATGVALSTLAETGANTIAVIIRDDAGAELGAYSLLLNANGHDSFMLPEQFGVTSAKRGSVEFRSVTNTALSGIGLRFAPNSSFTSLPTARAVQTGVFSQVASGGSWKTTLNLLNPHSTPLTVKVSLRSQNGSAWALPLKITSGADVETISTAMVERTLDPYAGLVIESEAPQSVESAGWASVNSSAPVAGFAIFRQKNGDSQHSEGTTALEKSDQRSFFLPFDNAMNFATGVALVNPIVGWTSTIKATFWDDQGSLLSTETIGLNAQGHTSFMMRDKLPATKERRGSVLFEAPTDFGVAGIGLRFSPFGTFTSVPSVQK